MIRKEIIFAKGLRLAIGLGLLVGLVTPNQLVGTSELDEQLFGEFTGELRNASRLADAEVGAESEKDEDNIETRAGECQGYSCYFTSSCGLAPLNRLGRGSRSSGAPFITNGDDQIYGEWPSYARVSIQFKDGRRSLCGGTIVSDFHILTAAHCVYDIRYTISKIEVRLGDHNVGVKDHYERAQISRYQCVPSSYIGGIIINNDWAVLTLKARIKFDDHVQPACLPYGFTGRPKYRECHLVGAGVAEQTGITSGKQRPIIQKQRVRQVRCSLFSLTGTHEACYSKDGSPPGSSCFGDSGGPILCLDSDSERWTVVAIVSRGNDCSGKAPDDVYERVTTLLPRIKKTCGL